MWFLAVALALAIAFAAGLRAGRHGDLLATLRLKRLRQATPASPCVDTEIGWTTDTAAAPPQRYSFVPSQEMFTHVAFDDVTSCETETRDLDDQPAQWRGEMAKIGRDLERAGVKTVVFVHGTFVGDDPLAISRVVGRVLPGMRGAVSRAMRRFAKDQSDRLLGDNGNYVGTYISLFEKAIGGTIPCLSFVWSGENHHLARVLGAVRLARELSGYALSGGLARPRLLIVGHSHAGQLFAILSQLLARSKGSEELLEAARARGEDMVALEAHMAVLRGCHLDIVTFGMPPRYGWSAAPCYRLMNVVNHRGTGHSARTSWGLLQTREGDYVQQMGVAGSDFPASTAVERRINERLDAVLGHGMDLHAWLSNVQKGLRVPQCGHTYLVDYHDRSDSSPNFVQTALGHGVYTRFDAMLFNAKLIIDHFYPCGRGRRFVLAFRAACGRARESVHRVVLATFHRMHRVATRLGWTKPQTRSADLGVRPRLSSHS